MNMLTKFSVKNYKQFESEIVFDLSAGNYAFNQECVKNGTVKTALIYGINGTGKSNLGWAIFDMVAHLTDNESKSLPSKHYVNANSSKNLVEFTSHFLFKHRKSSYKVEYKYSKDNNGIILSEHLFIDDNSLVNYEKGSPFTVKLEGTEHLNKNMNSSQNLSVLKYIHSNTNLDRRKKNNSLFISFIDFVNHMLWFRNVMDGIQYVGHRLDDKNIYQSIVDNSNLKDFEKFLNLSGIVCELDEMDSDDNKTIAFKFGKKRIKFGSIASTGTKSLAIFYYWWQQLKINKTPLLFLDEFDSSFHFKLSSNIVEKLKELENTQVILTTHNTHLLNNDLIRPDCGFIINGKQIKALHKSTQKELREAHNLEKLYKAGTFDV